MASVQGLFQDATIVTLKNNSMGRLKLDRFGTWYGKPVGGLFPDTILPKSEVKFTYKRGDHQTGCVAAVQYSGRDTSGDAVAVVVAWDAPEDCSPPRRPNRVYAISGAQNDIDKLSWEDIILVLEKASTSSSDTFVEATIEYSPDNLAILEVDIDLPLRP